MLVFSRTGAYESCSTVANTNVPDFKGYLQSPGEVKSINVPTVNINL